MYNPAAAIREQPVEIVDDDTRKIVCTVKKAGPKTHISMLKAEIEQDTGIALRLQRLYFGARIYTDVELIGKDTFMEALEENSVAKLYLERLSPEEADKQEGRDRAIDQIKNGAHMQHMEDEWRSDPQVVLYAVEHSNPAELQHASDAVKSDWDTMMQALTINTTCMYYVADTLWQDRSFMKKAVSIDGLLLGAAMVPAEWRSDVEVVMYACENHGYALKYASEALKNNRSVVLAAVNQRGTSLMYASEELRADYYVVLDAVRNNKMAIVHAMGGLREDDEIRAASGQGPSDCMIKKVERIKGKFHELDVNGDGFLSYEELETLLRKGNPELEEDEIRLLYDQMDTHSDGQVDFHEFCDYVFGDHGDN